MGLLAWLLLLAAPLLLLLGPRARQDRPIVLGAVLLTTGQLVLGISNATFGILPQTMIYAVATGYFLVRARRLAWSGGAPD
jgi:O-antigen ligase